MVKLLKKIKMKNLLRNSTLVIVSFLAFSCADPEEGKTNLSPTSITKLIAADATNAGKFSTFSAALEMTGMDVMLDEPGDYTVFAPTDAAFAGVLGGLTLEQYDTANPGKLQDILKNHVINSALLTKDLTEGQTITTSLGQTITVDLEPNAYFPEIDMVLGAYEETSIFINSARIYARDAKASNGRINEVDAILEPVTGS